MTAAFSKPAALNQLAPPPSSLPLLQFVSSKQLPGGEEGARQLAASLDIQTALVLHNCDLDSLADPKGPSPTIADPPPPKRRRRRRGSRRKKGCGDGAKAGGPGVKEDLEQGRSPTSSDDEGEESPGGSSRMGASPAGGADADLWQMGRVGSFVREKTLVGHSWGWARRLLPG